MLFKVGDRIIVSEPEDWGSGPSFVPEMARWCGKVCEVESVVHEGEHGGDGGWYTLVGGDFYYFAGDWMKKVVAFKGNK